jgi:copper oxidase (laccase) domain-containing protein
MLHHIVAQEDEKIFAFGWDQPLMSFFLQVFDITRPENDQIIVWLGSTNETKMYEVEDLVREANKHGLTIDYPTQVKLYGEKDDGV